MYLLQTADHALSPGSNIYKVGCAIEKSGQEQVNAHGQLTKVVMQVRVHNAQAMETEVITAFTAKFTQVVGVGRGYFKGDRTAMEKEMLILILTSRNGLGGARIA